MVKSSGIKKLKTAIFISGNGSNMKNLIRFSKTKNSPIVVDFVLSNNKKANGITYVKKTKINFSKLCDGRELVFSGNFLNLFDDIIL